MTGRASAAAGDAPGIVRFFVPSISHALFTVVFLHLALNVGNVLLADGDTGYHVRAGELILRSMSVPHQDSFSFLSPPLAWTAHEWLSEVIMALVHRAFGLTGLVLFFMFVIALTYAALYSILRSCGGNFLVDLVVVVLVIVSSQVHWWARPHLFSLLILVGWYFLLDAYQYRDRNFLYFLPPLMLLWVNLHGGFIFGFVLLGTFFAGNVAKALLGSVEHRERSKARAKVLAVTGAACLVVSMVNPYGHHILAFPFRAASDAYLMNHVGEFLSPDFHQTLYVKYLLFVAMAIMAFSRTPLDIIEVALTIFWLGLSLFAQRYIPLFAVIVAPILSRHGSALLEQEGGRAVDIVKRKSANLAAIDAAAKGFLWPVVAVLVAVAFAAGGRLQFRFDERKKPVAAVEFLKRADLRGNMFNNDEFGDYVVYAAHPQYKVFIDGRSDMYGSGRLREYFAVMEFRPEMEAVLEKYDIKWLFIETDSVLARHLSRGADWRLIYSDNVASIFVRDIPLYADAIGKYGDARLFTDASTATDSRAAERVPASPAVR